MSFFKKIFGGKAGQPKEDNGASPTRPLNLQFPAAPANGSRFAQQFIEAVKQNDDKILDYSVGSLDFVEQFLQQFRSEGLRVNDFAETIFVAGAYVGEVMIKHNNGCWIRQEEANLPAGVSMMPIVVQLANGNIVDPIAKAFKRFHYGETESITYFYQVFTR